MMDRKFWVTVGLSIATVWGVQWYFGRNIVNENGAAGGPINVAESLAVPGKASKVMTAQDFYRPLDKTVQFDEKTGPVSLQNVQTKNMEVTFSNQGGVITHMAFKQHLGKDGKPLATVLDHGFLSVEAKQKACFLVALDQQTPFIYDFVDQQEDDAQGTVSVVYKAEAQDWIIKKTFVLYQDLYKIDIRLAIEPKGEVTKPVRMRLIVPAPWAQGVVDNTLGLVALDMAKNALEKADLDKSSDIAWPWNIKNPLFGLEDKYFAHVLVADEDLFVQRSFIRDLKVLPKKVGETGSREVFAIFESAALEAAGSWTLSFYVGPKAVTHLTAVDDRLDDLMSFGWLSWLCKLLLSLLEMLFAFLGNYGLAITALALVLRLPLVPLSVYSRRKMEIYQKYAPTIQKIRQKYRQDLRKQQEEIIRFHQDHNLSSAMPIIGCLPMLLQLPILFALFRVLGNHINLYNAPFYGWIVDLSGKDPYYVLPILMGAAMLWQQLLTPTNDEKQRVMMMFMTLIFTVFFAKAAAGLVIYWLINNVVTIGEDYLRRVIYK